MVAAVDVDDLARRLGEPVRQHRHRGAGDAGGLRVEEDLSGEIFEEDAFLFFVDIERDAAELVPGFAARGCERAGIGLRRTTLPASVR